MLSHYKDAAKGSEGMSSRGCRVSYIKIRQSTRDRTEEQREAILRPVNKQDHKEV